MGMAIKQRMPGLSSLECLSIRIHREWVEPDPVDLAAGVSIPTVSILMVSILTVAGAGHHAMIPGIQALPPDQNRKRSSRIAIHLSRDDFDTSVFIGS